MKVKNCVLDYRFKLKIKTQKEFAEYLDINPQTYNKYENNVSQPPLEVLYDIAKILGVSITDICYPADEKIPDIPKNVEVNKNENKNIKNDKDIPNRITSFSF